MPLFAELTVESVGVPALGTVLTLAALWFSHERLKHKTEAEAKVLAEKIEAKAKVDADELVAKAVVTATAVAVAVAAQVAAKLAETNAAK